MDIHFDKLNENITRLVTDRPPTIDFITNSTDNVTSAVSFSESLKSALSDITGPSVNVDDMNDMLDVINEDDNRGTNPGGKKNS